MAIKNHQASLVLFLMLFWFYGFHSAPHLAPYRDAGEMACDLMTLGVAHPPGYPLYTLAGSLSRLFAFGNHIYRMNIFSSFCGALALVFLFLLLRHWMPMGVAFPAVLFVSLTHPLYELSCVSEMYSLGALWFCMVLWIYFVSGNILFLGFVFGLGLGVRMDLLLILPVLLFWGRKIENRKISAYFPLFFLMGSSIYLYLTIRSSQNPWLDWGNPETFMATVASATRKSYSGTLDLLSLSYRRGENFLINMNLYIRHVISTYGWAGGILMGVGLVSQLRRRLKAPMLLFLLFLVMGPFFLFLANMPPNPHAMAIVEASYLFPHIILGVFVAWGLEWTVRYVGRTAVFLIIVVFLPLNTLRANHRSSKRHNFNGRDYVENIWRSIPKESIVIFHDDVQLFSLWASQLVDARRRDVALIAEGLSGSAWYWDMIPRWPTKKFRSYNLKNSDGWQDLVTEQRGGHIMVGYDVDFSPLTPYVLTPHGFVVELTRDQNLSDSTQSVHLLKSLGLFRSHELYGVTSDFFSSDLIEDYSKAYHKQAFQLMLQKNSQAVWYFKRAAYLNSTLPRAWSDLGYFYIQGADWAQAETAFEWAEQGYSFTFQLAETYKSLPEVMSGIRHEFATTLMHAGVVQERRGNVERARNYYERSLSLTPLAQTNYNLAVTYWDKDWERVIQYLEAALRLDPGMTEAMKYLQQALYRRNQKRVS